MEDGWAREVTVTGQNQFRLKQIILALVEIGWVGWVDPLALLSKFHLFTQNQCFDYDYKNMLLQ